MSQAKRASKGKRPSKAVSVLGIAGASLAASTGGSLADIPVADIPSQNTAPFQFITLGEEEISASAWRRSISSTRKASEHRGQA